MSDSPRSRIAVYRRPFLPVEPWIAWADRLLDFELRHALLSREVVKRSYKEIVL